MSTQTPAPLRKLGGLVCLLLAAAFLGAVVFGIWGRFGTATTKVLGTIERSGTEVHLGQPRKSTVNAQSFYITLRNRLAKSRGQPVFGRQPSLWPTDEAAEIAGRLKPGMPVEITVDATKLAAAIQYLEEQERIRRSHGLYPTRWFGPTGDVYIVALKARGKTVIGVYDGIWWDAFTAVFLLLGALMFGAVGTALVRGDN
jgi:hypothetical protein